MRAIGRTLFLLLVFAALGALGWKVWERLREDAAPKNESGGAQPAPVEAAAVARGPIELRRVFTGTLEAPAELIVAPKVAGRVEELTVDLADPVRRGQIVARLDNDEYVQAVAQADADEAVAAANLAEAESSLEIAVRALERAETLRERGVSSESQLDVARAERLAKGAAVEVARAQVRRAEAARKTAGIRLGYTEIAAQWTGGDDTRVVAQRFVDEGVTVSANAPLLSIVELDPINGVIHVAERDYARLAPGQTAQLTADAFPGERFEGTIARIAPTFRQQTRQARVELTIGNPGQRLKPGMFVRAMVVLQRVEDAVIVPEAALTKRGDATGVFVVVDGEPGGTIARWQPVDVGIRAAEGVQIRGTELSGRVVTLGQQLLDDGSAIVIPDAAGGADAVPRAAE
jgi:RND family efflux transporter MFP subunit